MQFVDVRMDLKSTVLSEINQRERDRHWVIYYVCCYKETVYWSEKCPKDYRRDHDNSSSVERNHASDEHVGVGNTMTVVKEIIFFRWKRVFSAVKVLCMKAYP